MKSILNFRPANHLLELPKTPLRVLGVDLGTTNSSIVEATWDPAAPDVFQIGSIEVEQPTLEGMYTNVLVPSVVALYGEKRFIGEGAKRLRARAPELGLEQYRSIFYECKNEMGLRRTYHRAVEGCRSASEIGSIILADLQSAAKKENNAEPARLVISVPASFQIAQRQDTLLAATLAGIPISPGDLIDEPIAAFLDYMMQTNEDLLPDSAVEKNLLVFDFGGGTCDVAILRLQFGQGPVHVSPLAVSRYHRLGGGDIDRAIVYDVLLEQLREQNGLTEYELTYDHKKRFIEPAFLSVAEALKVGLSIETARLRKFGQYDAMRESLVKTQPGTHTCQLPTRKLTLRSPRLSAVQFEKALSPFLERDLLYAHETEYRLTCSIFAPLADALNRAGLGPEEINLCLMVGGSSLIPQVQDAVAAYFPQSKMLAYADRDSMLLAVARGAAIHAISLALFNRGITQPVCHNSISIRTGNTGLVELIPKGVELPYPADGGFKRHLGLAVPEMNRTGTIPLRVEFVAGADQFTIESGIWQIADSVGRGDPLCLEYRLDENQVLFSKLSLLAGDSNEEFKMSIEHPLTNVVNPELKRVLIDEIEEDLRTSNKPKKEIAYWLTQLADLYSDVGQREKAVDFYRKALQARNQPDSYILNRLGIIYGELGDVVREAKCYQEAATADITSGIPLFNFALSQRRQQLYSQALTSIDEAIRREPDPPYFVLKALILKQIDRAEEAEEILRSGLKLTEEVSLQSEWELRWYHTGLQMAKNEERAKEVEQEIRSRKQGRVVEPVQDGLLPIVSRKGSREPS